MIIYNLTRDLLRVEDNKPIRSEQIMTEQGICYVTNNYLCANLSAKYEYFSEKNWNKQLYTK